MTKTCHCYKLDRISYGTAWEMQRKMVNERRNGQREDSILLLEHDPVYTIGRAGSRDNILVPAAALKAENVTVFEVDRGGDITYHGPGQLVGYPILDLALHGRDLHRYVRQIEEVIIQTIAVYKIKGWREQGLTGVWTEKGKIAAIGVGVKGWVSMHGFALNVKTDMKYFGMINPCGITDRPVASMKDFGINTSLDDVAEILLEKFADVFEIKIIPARSKQDAIITS